MRSQLFWVSFPYTLMQCLQLRPQIIVNATDFLPALVFLCLYQKALAALYNNCVPNDPFRTSKAGFRIQNWHILCWQIKPTWSARVKNWAVMLWSVHTTPCHADFASRGFRLTFTSSAGRTTKAVFSFKGGPCHCSTTKCCKTCARNASGQATW